MARRKTTVRRRKAAYRSPSKKRFWFLSWPSFLFLVVCVGVLMVGWTLRAGADDIHVTGEVHANLPSGPAVIESPAEGRHFSSVPITVSGGCPADGSGRYIKLYRNDVFSGSALCSGTNRFSLQTDLFAGANKLQARIFNLTDDEGAISNIINVFYDVPATVPPPPQPTPYNPTGSPFAILTDFKIVGYSVGQDGKWNIVVSGGSAPYALNVTWGDGKSTLVSRKTSGEFIIEHQYRTVGTQDHSSYVIKIVGTDSDGRQAFLQLFAIVNPSEGGAIASTVQKLPPRHWLWIAWPAYVAIILMALSYWLGEREELVVLRKRGSLR